jgi:hypothetical protein
LYNPVLPFSDKRDGSMLRGVRIEHEIIVRRRALIELGGLDVGHRLGQLLS